MMLLKNISLKIFTIGVYGFNLETFISALVGENVDTLCDIRYRRGLRGKKYSWANSLRLQASLKEHGVNYIHMKHLAPTPEIRTLQHYDDKVKGLKKSQRGLLSDTFISEYSKQILSKKNIDLLLEHLNNDVNRMALFCVEKFPEACHRSILAQSLRREYNLQIQDLVP